MVIISQYILDRIILILMVLGIGQLWLNAEKRSSYMEGRESVYNSFHDEAESPYIKGK